MGDLQTGSAHLVEGNYVSFILAQIAGTFAAPNPDNPAETLPAKPINMRMIADTSQMQPGNQALYVLPDSPYKTVQELVKAHAEVGVNTLHNIGTVFLGSLLASDGYGVNALKQVPEPLPDLPQLLAKGVIPAAWLPEPFGTQAEQDYGAVQLADFDQGSLENFPIGTIVGDTTWVRSHPDTVAAFLRARRRIEPKSVKFPTEPIAFPQMAGMLASGQIAAATLPEPFASQAEQQYGAVPLADLNQGATENFPIEGYVVAKTWAEQNPNTLKRFLAALEIGQEISDTDRAAVEQASEAIKGAQNGQVTPGIAAVMALDTYPIGVDETRLQRVADVMYQFGVLKQQYTTCRAC